MTTKAIETETCVKFWTALSVGFDCKRDLKILKDNDDLEEIIDNIDKTTYSRFKRDLKKQLKPFRNEIEKYSNNNKKMKTIQRTQMARRIIPEEDFSPDIQYKPKNIIEEVGDYVKNRLPDPNRQRHLMKYLCIDYDEQELEDLIKYLRS